MRVIRMATRSRCAATAGRFLFERRLVWQELKRQQKKATTATTRENENVMNVTKKESDCESIMSTRVNLNLTVNDCADAKENLDAACEETDIKETNETRHA